MLTVDDVTSAPELELQVVAGERGLSHPVTWLHASELSDPAEYLDGGELLVTTGSGFSDLASGQRAFVRRLADRDLAGMGLCLGFGFSSVPEAVVAEANRLDFAVFAVPPHIPSIAISKLVSRQLASVQLRAVMSALEVNEQLTREVVAGSAPPTLVAILSNQLRCSVALLDENRRTIAERHPGQRVSFDGATELPIVAGDQVATLVASRPPSDLSEGEQLVLQQGQNVIALQLSLRRAVSAAELRLAGDLLADLEEATLSEREIARKMTAFGLRPERRYVPVLVLPPDGLSGEQLRTSIARELDHRPARYLSTARTDRAEFLVEARGESSVLQFAEELVTSKPGVRVGIGRAATAGALARSIAEARACLCATQNPVASYRDLGTVELLLSLPHDTLSSFVDQVLEEAVDNEPVMDALQALIDADWRWKIAADELGIHRHTLRNRIQRLHELTGRDPDDSEQRTTFWFALKAKKLIESRERPNGSANGKLSSSTRQPTDGLRE